MHKSKPNDSQLLLLAITGSRAYGTAHAGSDYDYKGVFAAHSIDLDGLYPITDQDQTWVSHSDIHDKTYHEAAKFCRLAAKSNPTSLEILWSKPSDILLLTRLGQDLIRLRDAFPSANSVRLAYFEYAKQQLKLLKTTHTDPTDDRRARHAKHLRRLLGQGYELWSQGRLTLQINNPGEYHEFGERCQADTTNALVEELIADYDDLFAVVPSVLQEKPDISSIQYWLRRVRNEYAETTNYRRDIRQPIGL